MIADISVDQGGCIETTHPTSHSNPVYTVDGVIHYCVDNMPGIYPQTSTMALSNVTLPYVLELADMGIAGALQNDPALAKGVNVYRGEVTHAAVAESLDVPYKDLSQRLRP